MCIILVGYKNNIHIPSISTAEGQSGSVSMVVIEEILLFSVISLMLRTGFEDDCYEHVLTIESAEDNQ